MLAIEIINGFAIDIVKHFTVLLWAIVQIGISCTNPQPIYVKR
jgi:hypothetical protein